MHILLININSCLFTLMSNKNKVFICHMSIFRTMISLHIKTLYSRITVQQTAASLICQQEGFFVLFN